MRTIFCLLFNLALMTSLASQDFFAKGWKDDDPVLDRSKYDFNELVSLHEAYLNEAMASNDSLKELYGLGYLFIDHMIHGDFVKSKSYILRADEITSTSQNPQWLGWNAHNKGILSMRLRDMDTAKRYYKSSVAFCREAQDSLCIAQGLEQIGSIHSNTEKLDSAKIYYEIAWPIIQKFGSARSKGATASNFGTLLLNLDRPSEALTYYKHAIAIFDSLGYNKPKAQGMNNYGAALLRLNKYDQANKILNECIILNKENNFLENLVTNYKALRELSLNQGDYKKAHEYLELFTTLQDSLTGTETQRTIAELESQFKNQQQTLELADKNKALADAQYSLLSKNILIAGTLLFLLVVIGFWWYREYTFKEKNAIKRYSVDTATRMLKDKNRQIRELQETLIVANQSSKQGEMKENLYNLKILTDNDWVNFLGLFEDLHPNFINKIRRSDLQLSPAEERLFLLLKLKRSRSEIAEVLGVSTDSVKKTRNRLRKRIGLSEKIQLEDFIKDF